MLGNKKKSASKVVKPEQKVQYDELATMHGVFETIVPDSYKNRKGWVRPDPREVYSFIPGTITEISVAIGQDVKKGDKLLMFKAMKMDNTFLSPVDGRVKVVHVAVGDIVPKGVKILEFE